MLPGVPLQHSVEFSGRCGGVNRGSRRPRWVKFAPHTNRIFIVSPRRNGAVFNAPLIA